MAGKKLYFSNTVPGLPLSSDLMLNVLSIVDFVELDLMTTTSKEVRAPLVDGLNGKACSAGVKPLEAGILGSTMYTPDAEFMDDKFENASTDGVTAEIDVLAEAARPLLSVTLRDTL